MIILDLLAGAVVNETVHWSILKMRDELDHRTDPYRKTLNKMILDLENKKFKREICDCVKNTILLEPNQTNFMEKEDISDYLYQESLSNFEKDYRIPNKEEINEIKKVCEFSCNEFENVFTYIISKDPTYEIYKILISISIPSIEIYLDKKHKFAKKRDTIEEIFFKEEPD